MSAQAMLPLEDVVALGTTIVDDVSRARAYVDARRVICRDCGDDDVARLVWLHRAPGAPWTAPLARLVQVGASNTRLAMELAACLCVCRRCQLRRVIAPKMLRVVRSPSVGVVAKVAITRCGGRNPEPGIVRRRPIESLSDRRSLTESSLTRP